MSDVKVPATRDNAVLLLAQIEKDGVDPGVLRTTTQGYFLVPAEIAESVPEVKVIDDGSNDEKAEGEKAPARKRAAKKTAPKNEKE